jgi:quercetin dioxygenase-like cupin family protein
MTVNKWIVLLFGLFCFPLSSLAQDAPASDMTFAALKTSKFANLPGLPACLKVSVQHGDPTKGSAALMLKFAPGCVVPWHWHTAGEQLIVISGSGSAQMKDGKPSPMHAGDYAYLPAKSVHQFKAVTATVMLDLPDDKFDIHYVDQEGKEIGPEKALQLPHKKSSSEKSSSKQ